jgi:hypothetical protein
MLLVTMCHYRPLGSVRRNDKSVSILAVGNMLGRFCGIHQEGIPVQNVQNVTGPTPSQDYLCFKNDIMIRGGVIAYRQRYVRWKVA